MSDVALSALGVSLVGDAAAGVDQVGATLVGSNGSGLDPAVKSKIHDAESAAFAHPSAVAGDPEQAQRDTQAAK